MTASEQDRALAISVGAGPLDAVLESVDLAALRYEGRELLRRVGVRVRSPDWDTVPPRIEAVDVNRSSHRTEIVLRARNDAGQVAFAWTGTVTLTERSVTYQMDGVADTAFPYARLGIVLLHPPMITAGRPYRARRGGRECAAGLLPELVGPQLIVAGEIQPLFPAFDELEIDVAAGLRVHFRLEGDLFEMEDQRNWTDASFKTYSTPVGLPRPNHAKPGTRFRQRAELHIHESRHQVRRTSQTAPAVVLGSRSDNAVMPAVGTSLGRASAADSQLAEALSRLRPGHLRVELGVDGTPSEQLADLAALVRGAGADLELELALPADDLEAQTWLTHLATILSELALTPARVALARVGEPVTTVRTAHLAREHVGVLTLLGGAPGNFAELNRDPPPAGAPIDGLYYAVNPQVHDTDDRSIMQSPSGQRATVATALQLPGRRPVHLTPITFQPRHARHPDSRQGSPIAAAWLVASADAVVSAGVASATWFELWGPFGLCQSGRTFPTFHVLCELCSWRGLPLAAARSSEVESLAAIGVHSEAGTRLLVANLTGAAIEMRVEGLVGEIAIGRVNADGWTEQTAVFPGGRDGPALAAYETALLHIPATAR